MATYPIVGDDRNGESRPFNRECVAFGALPGVLSASVTSPISDSMVPLPYMIGVVGVIGPMAICICPGGPIEKFKSPDLESFHPSRGDSGRIGSCGGQDVESYSPYGNIISGFVRVGDAGKDGNAIVAVTTVC